MVIDLADVQGTILRGYRADYARHFVLQVTDPAGARRILGSLVQGGAKVPRITTAARWTSKPSSFLNVGITYQGLLALGLSQEVLTFPDAFQRGATSPITAKTVGDVGRSDPSRWTGGLSAGEKVHLILSLWATDSLEVLEEVSAELRAAFNAGFHELSHQDAAALPNNKVHFGYTDNISQPTIDGAPSRKTQYHDHQPVCPTGEFLLGHLNQYRATYKVQPDVLSKNSSFSAYRILEQDVAGFEEFLTARSGEVGTDPETLAAKVCGRWRNGVPLVLSPSTPDPTPPITSKDINNYDYVSDDPARDDTFGYRCPVGSHMRRTNPRGEQVVDDGSHRHRIVRRAMPFGPLYVPNKPDSQPRGLVGHFINADLGNQFEFIMGQWVNTDSFVRSVPRDGDNPVKDISGRDVLIGAGEPPPTSFTLASSSSNRHTLTRFEQFTWTLGGAYCYLPSIAALRALAEFTA